MISPDDFIKAWGQNVYRFPPGLLLNINIPEASRTFLLEAGLPQQAEIPLGLYVIPLPLKPENPPVQAARYPLMHSYSSSRFRLIAYIHYETYWGDNLYYAVEEGTGYVWLVVQNEGPRTIINSSIPQFAEALIAYRDFVANFYPSDPERSQIMPLIRNFEERLQQIDSDSMASPENDWPVMIADMKIQL